MADIEDAALHLGFDEASRKLDVLIRTQAQSGPEAFKAMQGLFAKQYAEQARRQLAGDDGFWRRKALRAIQLRGWDVPEDSTEFSVMVGHLSKCGLDLFRKAVETLQNPSGNFLPSIHTQNLSRRRQERAKAGEGIIDLFDVYASQRRSEGKKGDDTLVQDRIAVTSFAEFIGTDRNLRSVAASEVREWRNAMAALPVGYRKRKEFKGLSIRQAVERRAKLTPLAG
ncbi:hypothetical protein DM450_10280 [Sphingomonas sp. IC081]|nr:hypothetical protein DM450_10280 [Sphingomonas sp. IC081]